MHHLHDFTEFRVVILTVTCSFVHKIYVTGLIFLLVPVHRLASSRQQKVEENLQKKEKKKLEMRAGHIRNYKSLATVERMRHNGIQTNVIVWCEVSVQCSQRLKWKIKCEFDNLLYPFEQLEMLCDEMKINNTKTQATFNSHEIIYFHSHFHKIVSAVSFLGWSNVRPYRLRLPAYICDPISGMFANGFDDQLMNLPKMFFHFHFVRNVSITALT